MLSISESFRLTVLPPSVVGLTRLKALHIEKCPSLERLPDNLLLPHLVMMRWAGLSGRGLLEGGQCMNACRQLDLLALHPPQHVPPAPICRLLAEPTPLQH